MASPLYDPFPKYLQIRDILLRRLAGMSPGDRLPTELALAEQFQVSRVTIRQVLDALAEQGIIARRRRLGTFLVTRPERPADRRLTGPIEDVATLGLPTQTRPLEQGAVAATPDVAEALDLAAGASAYEIRRVRYLEGAPLLLLEAFFPAAIGPRLVGQVQGGGLFVPALRTLLGGDVREDYQQIEALSADAEMAGHLEIDAGAAVLCVKRRFVDEGGQPLAFFKTNYRADRYYHTIKLPQAGSRREAAAQGAKRAPRRPGERPAAGGASKRGAGRAAG